MQRCRKRSDVDDRISSARFEEVEPRKPADFVFHSAPPIKVDQVGAATEQDVLAVVDNLASPGVLIRRCPSAQIRTPLIQPDVVTSFRQGAASGQTGKSAANNRYALL